jgi:hypothetical protein
MISASRITVQPKPMRRLLGILFVAWALAPSAAAACGLTGPWYARSDDGYTGIFIIEKVIDESSCEAPTERFLPARGERRRGVPRAPIG